MAAPTLSVLSSPIFPQALDHMVSRLETVVRRAEISAAESHLVRCSFEDQHSDCRALGTVHHLASEFDFCERHFRMVEEGKVTL